MAGEPDEFTENEKREWEKTRSQLVKRATDTTRIIEILEDATFWPIGKVLLRHQCDEQELNLSADLIDEGWLRGQVTRLKSLVKGVSVHGITIKGRENLDRLKRQRRERSLRGRIGKMLWGAGGTIFGAVITHLADIVGFVGKWWSNTGR